jgi:hypothetical protein
VQRKYSDIPKNWEQNKTASNDCLHYCTNFLLSHAVIQTRTNAPELLCWPCILEVTGAAHFNTRLARFLISLRFWNISFLSGFWVCTYAVLDHFHLSLLHWKQLFPILFLFMFNCLLKSCPDESSMDCHVLLTCCLAYTDALARTRPRALILSHAHAHAHTTLR